MVAQCGTAMAQRVWCKWAPDLVQLAFGAWQLMFSKVRRDPEHKYDQDFDAAAAEHYSYIRYLAGSTGDPYCHLAPTMYAAKKVIDQLRGKLQDGRTEKTHPVLPANPFVVAWGQRGVSDGLDDFKKLNPDVGYKFGAAIEPLAAFSFSADKARKMGEYAQHPIEFISNSIGKEEK